VADDGGGLDRRRILAAATARGLVVADGEAASPDDLWRVLCRPGFSTAGEVTGISGRGVGLDVVERSVGALRGAVEVESRDGEGAVFRIRLPLTLAIIEGFGVGVGAETYLLPLENVRECVELPAAQARDDGPSGVADLRGQPLPFLRLRHHLGVASPRPARESVVVVEDRRQRIGLVVDRLDGGSQAVVKPLSGALRGAGGLLGTTVLGDGRVALILDVAGLVRDALRSSRARGAQL
jgi:two-component system chemotaxis sensor kinase CheA